MKFEAHHDIYLPAGQCWHMIYTLNFYKKKTTTKNKNQAKRNLMSTLDIRDVFDGISEACSMIVYFLYLEFDMNKYLKNWGNYEVLRIKLGGFIIIIIIISLLVLYGTLRCAAMILYAHLDFYCIDRFIRTTASLFWCAFVYIYIFYLFVVCRIYQFFWGALLRLLFCLFPYY